MMIRCFLLLISLIYTVPVFAQSDTDTPIFGAGYSTEQAPNIMTENVNASDGVYDKFVLIRWEGTEKGGDYRLFRATSAKGASMCELTKGWQKSTWFCDYSAEKGREYYYAVMEYDGKYTTPLSKFDKGFVRKPDPVAYEESLTSTIPDRYAAGKIVFMLVAELTTDAMSYTAGSTVPLSIGLQNIFEEPVARTDLRVYLSNDAIWDFSDTMLTSRSYSGFPANFKGVLNEKVLLPETMLPGTYHLIVVTAPNGNIINAKTGYTTFNIKAQ